MKGPISPMCPLRRAIIFGAALLMLLTPAAGRQPDPLIVAPIAQTKGPRVQIALSVEAELPTAPPRLMTYRVTYPTVDQAYLDGLARKLGVQAPLGYGRDSIMRSQGDVGLEVYPETGAFWYRDGDLLWAADAPGEPLDQAESQQIAQALLGSWELLPPEAVFESVGWSERTTYDVASGDSFTERMDLQVNYRVTVGGRPVVGPGGKIKVYLGDGYRVAGLYWAGFQAVEHRPLPVLDPAAALDRLAAEGIATTVKGARLASVTGVDLVYYAGPGNVAQSYLEPVYRFRGSVTGDDETREFTQYVPALEPSYRREAPIARDLEVDGGASALGQRETGR